MDFYNELKAGRSAEDIVAELTEQLNAAEARIKEEEAAEEAAKRAAVEAANAKVADFANAIRATFDAIDRHYPQFGQEELSDADAEVLAAFVVSLLDAEAKRIKNVLDVKLDFKKPTSTDDVFASFFKALGI